MTSVDEPRVRSLLLELLERHEAEIVDRWVEAQRREERSAAPMADEDLRDEVYTLLAALRQALECDLPLGRMAGEFEPLRRPLAGLSTRWARHGSSPTANALAVLALKDACVAILRDADDIDATELLDTVVSLNRLIDGASLLTFETYVQGREEVIRRQNAQLLELSTPVVRLWERVVALPLVGTLDSSRTQVVMENLLQRVQDYEAWVAIIDITGVPTVDTQVAQHLMQTVAATRLMGAECVISGIRPQTAQAIAQLGVDLADIITRATLADALATAIRLVGGARRGPDGEVEGASGPGRAASAGDGTAPR